MTPKSHWQAPPETRGRRWPSAPASPWRDDASRVRGRLRRVEVCSRSVPAADGPRWGLRSARPSRLDVKGDDSAKLAAPHSELVAQNAACVPSWHRQAPRDCTTWLLEGESRGGGDEFGVELVRLGRGEILARTPREAPGLEHRQDLRWTKWEDHNGRVVQTGGHHSRAARTTNDDDRFVRRDEGSPGVDDAPLPAEQGHRDLLGMVHLHCSQGGTLRLHDQNARVEVCDVLKSLLDFLCGGLLSARGQEFSHAILRETAASHLEVVLRQVPKLLAYSLTPHELERHQHRQSRLRFPVRAAPPAAGNLAQGRDADALDLREQGLHQERRDFILVQVGGPETVVVALASGLGRRTQPRLGFIDLCHADLSVHCPPLEVGRRNQVVLPRRLVLGLPRACDERVQARGEIESERLARVFEGPGTCDTWLSLMHGLILLRATDRRPERVPTRLHRKHETRAVSMQSLVAATKVCIVNTEREALQRFARAPMRTVRAADLADLYAHAGPELSILLRRGVAHRLAHGIYCAVPREHVGTAWRPTIEAAAAAIATALYGDQVPILTGLTAARMHRALPRAIGVGYVAVPTQRRALRLADRDGEVRFIMRKVAELDAVAVATELGQGLVTTPEQTVLDLARADPRAEDLDAHEAIDALWPQCDPAVLEEIAGRQRMRATLRRVAAGR